MGIIKKKLKTVQIKRMRSLNFLSITMLAAASASAKDVCRALVLSGGGNDGAWEAGVVWGMLNYGTPSDFEWDVVSGVSAGAINTAATAGWKLGEETEMATWLTDLWSNLHTDDIW